MIRCLVKFIIVLTVMAVVCTALWQLVGDRVYDCTDDGWLGFWRPGDWIHNWDGHPIATVQQIVHGRSMNEPDTIKEGWSVADLWRLWCAFVAVALLVSAILALVPWIPRHSAE